MTYFPHFYPRELSIGQYFEINLGALHLVAGVASQGTLNKWVTSYKIKYSSALNSAMQFYQEGGVDKVIFIVVMHKVLHV